MKLDAWFCMDCMAVRDLDIHARCDCCGSDSVTPAAGSGMGFPKTAVSDQPLPMIFRVAGRITGRAVMRQTLRLVAQGRCPASRGPSLPELQPSADPAVIRS
jgi:hypothetical protein